MIDAGTCTLIAALGALISPLVGLIAGILAALSVTLIVFSSQVLTETVFLFFFTLMLLAGARFLLRPRMVSPFSPASPAGWRLLPGRPSACCWRAVPLVFIIAMVQRRGSPGARGRDAVRARGGGADRAGDAAQRRPLRKRQPDHAGRASPRVLDRPFGDPARRWHSLPGQRGSDRGALSAASRRTWSEKPNQSFSASCSKAEVAREEMARLPLAAYVRAWLEGMVVNLGAPALLVDPRVRALPKPSFTTRRDHLVGEGTGLRLRRPRALSGPAGAGLIVTVPFLALEAAGFIMLAGRSPGPRLAGGVLAYFLMLNGPVATPKYRVPMEPVLIVLAAIPLARLVERHCRILGRGLTGRREARLAGHRPAPPLTQSS